MLHSLICLFCFTPINVPCDKTVYTTKLCNYANFINCITKIVYTTQTHFQWNPTRTSVNESDQAINQFQLFSLPNRNVHLLRVLTKRCFCSPQILICCQPLASHFIAWGGLREELSAPGQEETPQQPGCDPGTGHWPRPLQRILTEPAQQISVGSRKTLVVKTWLRKTLVFKAPSNPNQINHLFADLKSHWSNSHIYGTRTRAQTHFKRQWKHSIPDQNYGTTWI